MIWINLRNEISKSQEKTEELSKEIATLHRHLENSSETADEIKEPEPEISKEPEVFIQPEPVRAIVEPAKNLQPRKARKPISYEKYIGENLFGKIGILILILGVGLFMKYAIDKEWINETLHTILGSGIGGLLLLVAWRLKDSYRTFSPLLAGGVFAIFYVTAAIAYHYYGLLGQTVAFILLVLFTGFTSSLSILYNRRELAIIVLVGGSIAPFLVGSGDGNYWMLFTYVMILDLGMLGLSIYKKWGELSVVCLALTWTVFTGYTYTAGLDLMGSVQLTHLLVSSIAFYLIFLLSITSVVRVDIRGINQYLLGVIGLNNFIFLLFVLCLLQNMELERSYKGLVTLFVAAINFALFFWTKRKGEPFTFLMHTLLGTALTFVSVTIPIQLEGTFITLSWASEVMIILWFYGRFRLRVYKIFVWVFPILALGSYGMDVFHGCMKARCGDSSLFINGLFVIGIFTGLSYWVDAWLVRLTRISTKGPPLTGCVILYIAFVFDFYSYVDPSIVSFSCIETFTVAVLFAASILLGKSYLPMSRNMGGYGLLLGLSLSLSGGMSLWVGYDDLFTPRSLLWASLLLIGGRVFVLGRYCYKVFDVREKRTHGMVLYICSLSTILPTAGTNNLLNQLGLPDELSAGFSILLSLAGFIQMTVGMQLHLKVIRMISLATFSIILLKLVMVSLWLLPTIGKVVVLMILGAILLILSFLYQKLKAVLLDDSLQDIR